ncbi:extracellular solute-binding protein [Holdemanella biformis]|jgi:spermidine/putrescine transport system permease protein|uniref:extracellular solute-binding protein n=1 Tax=Holdemanella biformis TaxID=1735 RepID=UPI0025DECB19|nr:extracellular solute-binding protein [Holdemanella biformis]
MSKDKKVLGKVGMALLLVFFYAPILFMIVFSFNSSKSLTHFTGFSLCWYEAMLKNHGMMESLYVTIVIALLATVISTIVGTITAIGLSKSKKVLRAFVSQVNDFPIMNPEIVTAIGLMLLFITFQIEKGFVTLLLAHVAFCIPYVILSIMPKIKSLDPNLADAAMDLGATPWQALIKVIVPQIMPGIVSGALIAFTMSFDDFVISYFVTGQGVKNLSIMVYTMSKRINPSVNAISTLVVLLITITLTIVNILPIIRKKTSPSKQNKPWKWAVAGVVVVGLVASLFGLNRSAGSQPYAGQTLHVYNWGEYTGENIISGFEELTGAKVIMDNFDSNEQMYIKVANGDAYDVLVPSDYMIQRMMQEKMLQKLEPETRKECLSELTDAIKGLPYDPKNEYSIPYFWGTVGIVYDKTKVSKEDLENEGWNIFLDQKYKGDIYLYDSERDSFMMALKALGYSMNTTSEEELNEAYNWLVNCVQTMDPEIVTDEIIDNMAQARKALGLIYSGDAAYVMTENDKMGFYMPKSGTNLWSDAMVIPKNAKNPKLANEFVRYITSYDAAMDNSSYVGYTSPNKEVMEELGGKGGDYDGINAYTPRAGYDKDEVFQYDEATRKIIADLWSRVKVAASNAH